MPEAPLQNLSPRERQCLTSLAKGKKLKEIAESLGITVKTVDKQVLSARGKLSAATTEQAIAIAIRNNLLIEDDG